MYPQIESRQNPRLKNWVKLQERKGRREQNLFLIEGRWEIERAMAAGISLVELTFCRAFLPKARSFSLDDLLATAKDAGTEIIELTREAFGKVTLRDKPDGLLAVGRVYGCGFDDLRLPAKPLILVLEGIEKPGNLGAMIRTAAAAGVDAIIATDMATDPFNPHVIRNSRGLVFSLPLVSAVNAAAEKFLRERDVTIAASTPSTDLSLWEAPLNGSLAILAGAEAEGLSTWWLDRADLRVTIPMAELADSLNVAVSTAVFLFEAKRQRRAESEGY